MPADLTDKTIIITGASSGIGAATAVECARAGMDLVLTARRADRLEQTAEKVRQLGRRAEIIVGDVTDHGMPLRLLDCAEEHFGGFHGVFANAGYAVSSPVHETPHDEWRRQFEVNFFAGIDLLRAAAQRLLDAGRPGHLLMCSSCLSRFSLPRCGLYSATKAAQNLVCQAMRLELKPKGVYVSSVHPITTLTEFFEVATRLGGRDTNGRNAPRHTPGMFVQTPDRVARAVVRCLRRPRPEVWTSFIVRATAAVMLLFPRFGDAFVMSQARRDDE